eukprot:TRINITY_DN21777_c0_g1_i1.p1 TRINITY_DN21777_c0_g1~~TRINITY_DN21777_c0_g1_i1.p1  ORF type:complete len:116 (+),score=10.68 TRINITY_DN21777_c0_g1_i1:362-709(+)
MARVQDDGAFSEPFPVANGVKQGCVLTPTLYSIILSAKLSYTFRSADIGVDLRYNTNGSQPLSVPYSRVTALNTTEQTNANEQWSPLHWLHKLWAHHHHKKDRIDPLADSWSTIH